MSNSYDVVFLPNSKVVRVCDVTSIDYSDGVVLFYNRYEEVLMAFNMHVVSYFQKV